MTLTGRKVIKKMEARKMWTARVTIKHKGEREHIHKLEIRANQPKRLLTMVSKLPEEILEVLIYKQVD